MAMAARREETKSEERKNRLDALLRGPAKSILCKALEHFSVESLRKKIGNTRPLNFKNVLKYGRVQAKLTDLFACMSGINQSQWKCLYGDDYPYITAPGNVDHFDISLLVRLLLIKQVSGFQPSLKRDCDDWPTKGELEHRVEAHADVIRSCRNKVAHGVLISEGDFNTYFDRIKEAILYIAKKLDIEEEYSNINAFQFKTIEAMLERASITLDRDQEHETHTEEDFEREIIAWYDGKGMLNKEYLLNNPKAKGALEFAMFGKQMVLDPSSTKNGCLIMTLYCLQDREIPKVGELCPWMSTIFNDIFVSGHMRERDEEKGTPNDLFVKVSIEHIEIVQLAGEKLSMAASLLDGLTDDGVNLEGQVAFKAVTIRAEYALRSQLKKALWSSTKEDTLLKEAKHFLQLILLIHEIGTKTLRNCLSHFSMRKYEVTTFHEVLRKNEHRLSSILPSKQLNLSSGDEITAEQLDITTVYILICNICEIRAPKEGWNTQPFNDDTSLGGCLAQLKFLSKKLANSQDETISDQLFDKEFTTAVRAILNIQSHLPNSSVSLEDLLKYKKMEMSSQLESQLIDVVTEWYEYDSQCDHIYFKSDQISCKVGSSVRLDDLDKTAERQHEDVVKNEIGLRVHGSARKKEVLFKKHGGDSLAELTLHDKVSLSSLHAATQEGQVGFIKKLLDSGEDVNSVSNEGLTPVYLAAARKHLSVIKLLAGYKADVNLADNDGVTPLHKASVNGYVEIVKYLLKLKADITLADKNCVTPLHAAAQEGHIDVIVLLLKAGANVNCVNSRGVTPVYFATENRHLSVVKILADHHADINTGIVAGWTPLQRASYAGYPEIVKYLLKLGADITKANTNGSTALHLAAQEGHVNVVELLLNAGANVNCVKSRGVTPIYLATFYRHLSVIKLLVEHQVDVNLATESNFIPLHKACYDGSTEIVKFLLQSKADTALINNDGFTALHLAAQKGYLDILELLLGAGADVNCITSMGVTAVYLATENRHQSVIEMLVKNQADVNLAEINGWSPLQVASLFGYPEIVQFLLQCKADVTFENKWGLSALHVASQEGNKDVTEMLLNAGASVNCVSKKGVTPIYLATANKHLLVIKLLVEHQADVNLAEENGKTPLHKASYDGSSEIVKHLLQSKADISLADSNGSTAIDFTVQKGHVHVKEMLLKAGVKTDTQLQLAREYKHPDINVELCDELIPLTMASHERNDSKEKFGSQRDFDLAESPSLIAQQSSLRYLGI